jgi:hypothetical protein
MEVAEGSGKLTRAMGVQEVSGKGQKGKRMKEKHTVDGVY